MPDQRFKCRPIGHHAVALVGLAGLADGGVEVGPFLGLVLGLEEVAHGAEAVGVAPCLTGRQVAGLGQEDVGCAEVLLDALDGARAGRRV